MLCRRCYTCVTLKRRRILRKWEQGENAMPALLQCCYRVDWRATPTFSAINMATPRVRTESHFSHSSHSQIIFEWIDKNDSEKDITNNPIVLLCIFSNVENSYICEWPLGSLKKAWWWVCRTVPGYPIKDQDKKGVKKVTSPSPTSRSRRLSSEGSLLEIEKDFVWYWKGI